MNKFFKLSERKTTVRAEIVAGITTFMAMAYILMVNPGMFANLSDVTFGASYIATAISSVVGFSFAFTTFVFSTTISHNSLAL